MVERSVRSTSPRLDSYSRATVTTTGYFNANRLTWQKPR